MGRPAEPPRLVQWPGKGSWYIFATDVFTGKAVRKSCRALRAFTAKQRAAELIKWREREHRELLQLHALGSAPAYRTPLVGALADFVRDVDAREKARTESPDSREGLTPDAAENLRRAVRNFSGWLQGEGLGGIACERLDGNLLSRWGTQLSAGRGAGGVNAYRGLLRTCLRWLDARRPRLFPDSAVFWPALKMRRTARARGTGYSAAELQAFLAAAMRVEDPDHAVVVTRNRKGRAERFQQRAAAFSATPVSRLFVLLALTGTRRSEALRLQWRHVDLQRGRINIEPEVATKVGYWRFLPLAGGEREVAPQLVETLKAWRKQAPKADYVLPHQGLAAPVYPDKQWKRVRAMLKAEGDSACRITPQGLRKNFTSYAASLGVPAAVCAMWQGHSAQVAEDFYRQQVLEPTAAQSIQAAMGL